MEYKINVSRKGNQVVSVSYLSSIENCIFTTYPFLLLCTIVSHIAQHESLVRDVFVKWWNRMTYSHQSAERRRIKMYFWDGIGPRNSEKRLLYRADRIRSDHCWQIEWVCRVQSYLGRENMFMKYNPV